MSAPDPQKNHDHHDPVAPDHRRRRMTVRGHARALLMAVVFGLGAYAVVRLLIWLSHSMGSIL